MKNVDLIKAPVALITLIILIASIYLTVTSSSIGLFVPPIFCIAIAGSLIRFFDRSTNGKNFLYDTLALAGIFLLLFLMMFNRMMNLIPYFL